MITRKQYEGLVLPAVINIAHGIDVRKTMNEEELIEYDNWLMAYKEALSSIPELAYTIGGIGMNNVSGFKAITEEMIDIYTRKNNDYGNSFDKSLDEDGLLVSKIRLGDKYNRFSQLIKGQQQVSDESIEDTLIDMANYAIMTVKWMRNQDVQMALDLDKHDILETESSIKAGLCTIDQLPITHGADFDGDKCLEEPGIVVGYDLRNPLKVGTRVEIVDAMDRDYNGIVSRVERIVKENPGMYELVGISCVWHHNQLSVVTTK